MKIVLDTNVVYALFRNEPAVVTRLRFAEAIYLPLPVVAELLFAAKKSDKRSANLYHVRQLRHTCDVICPGEETARVYADIRLELEKKGRPIPVNDLWIAAICRERDLPLATRDAHFDEVEGLTVLSW